MAEVSGISGIANRVGDVARIMAPPGGGSLLSKQDQFSGIISRAKTDDLSPQDRARTAAEQLVATALVQPVLKQLRETNNAAAPFAPNQAERTFRGLFDAAIAQRMVHAQHWGLVDRLAQGMLKKLGANVTQASGVT